MYPAWLVPVLGSGLIIAIIATFHILPSHLATGSFWFNVWLERKAYKENRPELLQFLKKYVLLILIFCFVYGSITGVWIWFSATVSSPRAISSLIHNYVWGWATEWVFFIIEIVAIYVYYYTFGKIDGQHHLRVGWTYAWGAWISMVIITGILAFMLTPGKWLETGKFFDGFFNPTYWPQLFTRTALMFSVAGIYAIIVASRLDDADLKVEITRKAALWGIGGLILGAVFAYWYILKLPPEAKNLVFGGELPYLKTLLKVAVIMGAVVGVYYVVFGLIAPHLSNPVVGVIVAIILFLGIGAGEGFREGVRRPYIINYFMYGSSQVIARSIPPKGVEEEVSKLNEKGYLSVLYYLPEQLRTITENNKLEVGRVLVVHQCAACHTLEPNGVLRPLPKLLSGMEKDDIRDLLDSLGDYAYMPPFIGTDEEKDAAAAYLATLAK